MVGDHVNAFLFAYRWPALFDLGRLAFPLFAFVLVYNLAREGEDVPQRSTRVAMRLLVFGCLAQPIHAALREPWPLNVLFTLACIAMALGLAQGTRNHRVIAVLLCTICSRWVDFGAVGVAVGLSAWLLVKQPTPIHWFGLALSTAALGWVNGNLAALPSLVLFALAPMAPAALHPRRSAGFFYAFYPLHLLVLLVLR